MAESLEHSGRGRRLFRPNPQRGPEHQFSCRASQFPLQSAAMATDVAPGFSPAWRPKPKFQKAPESILLIC